jgi:hypothetical protein
VEPARVVESCPSAFGWSHSSHSPDSSALFFRNRRRSCSRAILLVGAAFLFGAQSGESATASLETTDAFELLASSELVPGKSMQAERPRRSATHTLAHVASVSGRPAIATS